MALHLEGAIVFSKAAHLKEESFDTVWPQEWLAFNGIQIIINSEKIESKHVKTGWVARDGWEQLTQRAQHMLMHFRDNLPKFIQSRDCDKLNGPFEIVLPQADRLTSLIDIVPREQGAESLFQHLAQDA